MVIEHEEETCLVCFEPLEFVAIGLTCKHAVCCALCTLRMRTLLKENRCVYCKSEEARILITKQKDRNIDDFQTWGDVAGPGYAFDEVSGAFFDLNEEGGKENMDQLLSLREHSCKLCALDKSKNTKSGSKPKRPQVFANIAALNQHLKAKHQKQVCELCAEFRGQFTQELELYTPEELAIHNKHGDKKTAFRGHEKCDFCNILFYNKDHLYKHLNEKHENCHICTRDPSRNSEYYRDYNHLERHFRKEHFVCTEQECLDNKFVVFATEVELHAHIHDYHPHLARAGGRSMMVPVNFTVRRSNGASAISAPSNETSIDSLSFSYNPRQQQEIMNQISTINQQTQQDLHLGAEAFPSLSGGSNGASGNIASRYNYGDVAGARLHVRNESDFPSLPGSQPMSRNARRRANRKAQQENGNDYADLRLGGNIRVIHKAKGKKRGKKKDNREPPPGTALNNKKSNEEVYTTPNSTRSSKVESAESEVKPNLAAQRQQNGNTSNKNNKDTNSTQSKVAEVQEIIKSCLHGDSQKFEQFKMFCKQFGMKKINAEAYYQSLTTLFSMKQITVFLPALANTLPDKKQAEALKEIHRKQSNPKTAKNSKKKPQAKNANPVQNRNAGPGFQPPRGATAVRNNVTTQRARTQAINQNTSASFQPPRGVIASQTSNTVPQQTPVTRTPTAAQVAINPRPQAPRPMMTQPRPTARDFPTLGGNGPSNVNRNTNRTNNSGGLRWRSDMAPWAHLSPQPNVPEPVPDFFATSQPAPAPQAPPSASDFPTLSSTAPKSKTRETGAAIDRWDSWQKKGKSKTFVISKKSKKKGKR